MSDLILEDVKKAIDLVRNIQPKPIPSISPSMHVPHDYTALSLPQYSKNRSSRTMKKLVKKFRQNSCYGYNKVWCIQDPITGKERMFCHPSVYGKIKEQEADENHN